VDAVVGAEWGKPNPHRLAQHNGYRRRELDIRMGTIDVLIPRLRSGTCFPELPLKRRTCSDCETVGTCAE
jgi:putative transposase